MDYIDWIPEVGESAYEERQRVLAEEVSGDCDCCDNWSQHLVTGEDGLPFGPELLV